MQNPAGHSPNPLVLIADLPGSLVTQARALSDHVVLRESHSYADAVAALAQETPELLIVGYHFDGVRPDRLIRHVREELALKTPIVLVQGLRGDRGRSDDGEIAHSYAALGVNAFVNWAGMRQELGDEQASQRFNDLLLSLLA